MAHIIDRHFCAGVGQRQRNRRADAGIAARDERAFSFKCDVHDCPLCLSSGFCGFTAFIQ